VRVVFDTNVFISAFALPGGNAEIAYLHAARGTFELFTSVAILTETANKLLTKFEWSEHKVEQFVRSVSKTARVLTTQPHLHILNDEPDNRILECAVLANADLVVTGDRHLLSPERFQDIRIVKHAELLQLLKGT